MDRGYMGSDGHEVKLTAEAVTGLIKMNVDESDASTDKQFIKALMIAIGPLEAFHSVNNISKEIKAFIKGNFASVHFECKVNSFNFVACFN